MSREMKDSGVEWIGKIPKNWDTIPLKRLSKIQTGSSPDKKEGNNNYSDESGIPWIKAENLGEFFPIHSTSEYLTENGCKLGRIYPPYTVYVCCIASIGKVGFSDIECSCNQQINGLSFNNIVNWKFGFYETLASAIEHIARSNKSVTPILNATEEGKIKFAISSPTEQQQIVHFLDRKCTAIDTAIEKTKKSIEKLEEYKKAVITKAVTKGIDPNAKMKDSGVEWIGEIPEDWEVKKLKHAITKLSKGNGITKDDVVESGDVSCVRYGEIYTQYNYVFDKCKTRTNMEKVSSPQTFSYGDILCAGTGELIDEIGKPIVYLGKELCLAGGDIIIIKHQQDPLFMSFLLNSAYCQGQRSIGKYKLKVVHISAGDIGNIKIALPQLNDQIKIAQFLKEKNELIDGMIKAKINSIMKLEEYKKSLIYYAVTGKIDCRNEVI